MPRNKKNVNLNAKIQLTGANTEITGVLELPNKDFKAIIVKILQQITMKILEPN